jgi:signal transduction histidine kinase
MEFAIDSATATELAAAFLQAAVTLGLVVLCLVLYRRFAKRHFRYWALTWALYALRLGAIITFLVTTNRVWLYWHQVTTGWTALGFLWAALVFSEGVNWRNRYLAVVFFPPVWSYLAIYQLENFLLAAIPAVLFLSLATVWTGWVFLKYHRQVVSTAARVLAIALFLWGLHHLDYPFLRAQGAWNPWGYYLDIVFELAMGAGIVLLVVEDLNRGLGALSALSGYLGRVRHDSDAFADLLERPLTLPAVRGSAMYTYEYGKGEFVGAAGVCAGWVGTEPTGTAKRAIQRAVETAHPEVVHGWDSGNPPSGSRHHPYTAALPILKGQAVWGALVIVGDARDPFAALDSRFLVTLGQQVGAALEHADLYGSLEARTKELELMSARMVRQHEDERRRLSRELHDETAQVFSAVKLQLGVLRESLEPDLASRLDRAVNLVDTGIQSIRNVTNSLRPSLLDDLGLVPALRALLEDFGARSGIGTNLEVSDAIPQLSEHAELALFRALQEGLANVAQHAHARSADVRLLVSNGEVELQLRDDGRGPPDPDELASRERDGHMGLAGMRERITALGGSVSLRPGLDRGAVLLVQLPEAS